VTGTDDALSVSCCFGCDVPTAGGKCNLVANANTIEEIKLDQPFVCRLNLLDLLSDKLPSFAT